MKIAFLAAASSPHTIKWANAMLKRGHEVSVFSLPEQRDEHSEIEEQITVTYLPYTAADGGLKKNVRALSEYTSSQKYDVINAIDACSYGFLAARAKLLNLMLTVTGVDVYRCKQDGKKGMVVKSLKHAKAVIAAAPNIVTHIKTFFKKDKNYFTVPFGVDTQKFIKKDAKKRDDETIWFGSLKPLEPYNGVEYVIEAYGRFLEHTEIETKLKIVGTGSDEAKLKTKVQNMGIKDKVDFMGYVVNDKMPDTINKMDVVVQMSEMESFGVPALEAMACEVPVISSDTVGASEYILNGVTGYLVKVGNTKVCAERMEELAKNKGTRENMGAKGRNDVEELYDLQKCAEKYDDALKFAAD